MVESDAEKVVKCITKETHGYAPIFLFYDAIRRASSTFSAFSISHVKRARNCVAHFVARWEINMDSEYVLFDSFSQSILTLAEIDLI